MDITHIERSNLPWRPERRTECGLDAERHPTWTRDEAEAIARDLGQQRFAFVVCMTCLSTAQRHSTWEQDPASCMVRHAERNTLRWSSDDEERVLFNNEIRAIALLVEAHRDEFDELVAGLGDTAALSKARADRQRRLRDMHRTRRA